jgi:pyruvate dehydrogenase E2 component (dihydrolipoamide acetyltransferase)
VASSRTPASPAVRKLAREKGVDLENVAGSGPGGRVTREDVEHAAKAGKHQSVQRQAKSDGHAKPQTAHAAGRAAISQARKTIARVMSESWATIPHVTDTDDADVTDLERLRKQYAAGQEAGDPKLTLLAFIIRAVSRALQKFPAFNASFDAGRQEIIHHEDINIAVGVHTERGLIAPVIRNADRLGIVEIARALAEIADKARKATFAVNDTRGGTYTISNPGAMGGSRYSTPIITPPQVAVLAAGRMKWMPWVIDGAAHRAATPGSESRGTAHIEPRLILPLSHSFDHRIIDGGEEVQFMRHMIDDLENPGRLIL